MGEVVFVSEDRVDTLRLYMKIIRGVCDRLSDAERFVREHKDDIPASSIILAHIVRAMEIAGCPRHGYDTRKPELERIHEIEGRLAEEGVIVE
jgi:hypothetical protein